MMRIFALLFLSICLYGCNRYCEEDPPPPPVTYFDVRKSGKTAPVKALLNAQLYWFADGRKMYENQPDSGPQLDKPLFGLDNGNATAGTNDSSRPVLYSTTMAYLSASQGIKNFYIEYADSTIDSLFVDYQTITFSEGRCKTHQTILNQIKFRGAAVPVDSSAPYHYPLIYIINK